MFTSIVFDKILGTWRWVMVLTSVHSSLKSDLKEDERLMVISQMIF